MSNEYTDDTIVTFGKYRGERLGDVPGSYLLYLYESQDGIQNPKLLKYVEDNYQALEMERNQSKF